MLNDKKTSELIDEEFLAEMIEMSNQFAAHDRGEDAFPPEVWEYYHKLKALYKEAENPS